MPYATLRAKYEQCGDKVVAALKTGDVACADKSPVPIKTTRSVTFVGIFALIVGDQKAKFLKECTETLSSNGREVECIDVRSGSIIVDLRGLKDALDSVEAEIFAANGLDLPSFERLLLAGVVECFCIFAAFAVCVMLGFC